jgi:hypothetical protein
MPNAAPRSPLQDLDDEVAVAPDGAFPGDVDTDFLPR